MVEQSLKEKTAKGLFWGGLSNGAQQLLNLLFGIFLARILTPSDYGMVGMLTIFSLIAGSLQESGFTAALTNKKEVTDRDYNAVFWFSISLSTCLYFLLFFCAPLIADFFNTPELTALARYSFLGFLIGSSGTAHSAYLFRNLKVKQRAMSSVIALVFSGSIGVTLAYFGFAYWGIATQSLVYIAVVTICYWCFSSWRPSFHIDFSPLRGMIKFSSYLLITNIFNHINNNLLSVTLGRYYSEKEVGYYNQANKWSGMGQQAILGTIISVAQPVLATTSNDVERQRQVFRKMLRFAAFISFPALFGLGLISKELIIITVTEKWLPSVGLIQLLCIGGAFTPIIALYQQLIISWGKSHLFMWNIIAIGILQVLAAILSYPYGVHIMLIIYVSINIGWLFVWQYIVWKRIKLTLFQTLKDIIPYVFVAACAILLSYYITLQIENNYFRISAKIIVAAIAYVTAMWAFSSVTFKESIQFLTKKIKA